MRKILLSLVALLGISGVTNAATGSADNPLTVDELILQGLPTSAVADTWVTGYIVGAIDGMSLDAANFTVPFTTNSNILLAGSKSETDIKYCIPVQIPSGDVRTALNLVDHPENIGKQVTICGSNEKYFRVNGMKFVKNFEWVGDAPVIGENPVEPAEYFYKGLTDNADDWTFQNVIIAEGLNYVWAWKTYGTSGFLNATGYNNQPYATESYAISPVLDLTKASDATISFEHAAKFQTNLLYDCKLVIREQGQSEWNELDIHYWPSEGNWNFVNSGDINIKSYAGKKVEIAFKYVSTSSEADTWEIRNFIVNANEASDKPIKPDTGSLINPVTVSTVRGWNDIIPVEDVYVKGYIVGWVDGLEYIDGSTFSLPCTYPYNLLIADNRDETNPYNCIPVQLPVNIRPELNLVDNPMNFGKEVILHGDVDNYYDLESGIGLKHTDMCMFTESGLVIPTIPDNPSGETYYIVGSDINGKSCWDNSFSDCLFRYVSEGIYEWYGDFLGTGFKINHGIWNISYSSEIGNRLSVGVPFTYIDDFLAPNIAFDDCTGLINPHVVLNTNTNTITVTGEKTGSYEWFFCGDFNDWDLSDTGYRFVEENNKYVIHNVPLPDYGVCKIISTGIGIQYGVPTEDEINNNKLSVALAEVGIDGNIPFSISTAYYDIIWDRSTNILTLELVHAPVIPPFEPTPDQVTIKVNTVNGASIKSFVTRGSTFMTQFDLDTYWTLDIVQSDGDIFITYDNILAITADNDQTIDVRISYNGDLEWLDENVGVTSANLSDVTVSLIDNAITIEGLHNGEEIALYSLAGQVIEQRTAVSDTVIIRPMPGIYVVRVDHHAVKVTIK